jgi:hypothetical protein
VFVAILCHNACEEAAVPRVKEKRKERYKKEER